ncbi:MULTISPECIES: DUF2637 domain-containing protein [Streptomyces]|uniref:DUF2637 domain-containing protein n=1 Tax=Streptomyces cacaoi TaxID=1898 RepID=A0A4Y3QXX2_STRCI|nr:MULTISPECIES: DUF2637 domain-containing protein [Streptomyces]GEB49453.1 hypothetical protein SCA03_20040 [Streptomyces cacaoi]
MTETSHTYVTYVPRATFGMPGTRTPREPDAGATPDPSLFRDGLAAPPHPSPEEPPDLDAELAYFLDTVEQPALVDAPADGLGRPRHRKDTALERLRESNPAGLSWRSILSSFTVTLTALIVVLVSFLGAQASYPPLYDLADDIAPPGVAHAWPMLIYAPWLAATLSILRTRVYRRRTVHSWLVVLFFAALASALCVAEAPSTPAGMAVAGLPPITALLCFHQLVRQLDLIPGPMATSRHARPTRGSHRHKPPR